MYLTLYSVLVYERKHNELVTEEALLDERLEKVGSTKTELSEYVSAIAMFAENAADVFEHGDGKLRKEVTEIVSSNLAIRDRKIASFGLREAFRWFAEDAASLLAGNGTFEPS